MRFNPKIINDTRLSKRIAMVMGVTSRVEDWGSWGRIATTTKGIKGTKGTTSAASVPGTTPPVVDGTNHAERYRAISWEPRSLKDWPGF